MTIESFVSLLIFGFHLEGAMHGLLHTTGITLAIDFFGETQEDQDIAQSGLIGGIWRSPWQMDFDVVLQKLIGE